MGTRADLEGQAALVTGGGTGIGLGIAKRLAADGALVTICARREDVLARAAEDIGQGARYVTCDVTDDAQVKSAVEAARAPRGRLDIAVANAGGSLAVGPLPLIDLDGWNATLAVNLTSTLSLIRHVAPVMARQGGGSIVAVSSIAGHMTHRHLGPYSVAKAAVEALVRNAADELGRYRIRVNAVRPGLVRTEMAEILYATDRVREDYLAQMSLGRVGTPEDVAAAVRFLAGSEASWITGQLLGVDGGHSLRRGPDLSPIFSPLFDGQLDERMQGGGA
jgi:NAD(P)-dependent dehydrogenase (short-subunit alcohol dehydrogenase family)